MSFSFWKFLIPIPVVVFLIKLSSCFFFSFPLAIYIVYTFLWVCGRLIVDRKWGIGRFRRRFCRKRTIWWMIRAPTTWFPGTKTARPLWCGRRLNSPRICCLSASSTTTSLASLDSWILMWVSFHPPISLSSWIPNNYSIDVFFDLADSLIASNSK